MRTSVLVIETLHFFYCLYAWFSSIAVHKHAYSLDAEIYPFFWLPASALLCKDRGCTISVTYAFPTCPDARLLYCWFVIILTATA